MTTSHTRRLGISVTRACFRWRRRFLPLTYLPGVQEVGGGPAAEARDKLREVETLLQNCANMLHVRVPGRSTDLWEGCLVTERS
jgi:hypothetical protein